MRVDAHQHFWDPARYEYPWMAGSALDPIRRAYGPADLADELERSGIDGTVLVQTLSSESETREFLRIAAATDFVVGVVGWVDLTAEDVDRQLYAHAHAEGGCWLVGIRHQVHDESDEHWLCRPDVRRGLLAVQERGLAYDLLLRAREIPAAIETVRDMPDLRFVVDHIAKPTIASGEDSSWAAGMKQLSAFPNVSVKLSGMITEADWANWTVSDLRPFVERVREWFGPGRLMFGSDWPVCLLAAASYQEVLDAYRGALGEISDAEAQAVLGGNAQVFYGLAKHEAVAE
jgi:L-fucono-1,5-lactonase